MCHSCFGSRPTQYSYYLLQSDLSDHPNLQSGENCFLEIKNVCRNKLIFSTHKLKQNLRPHLEFYYNSVFGNIKPIKKKQTRKGGGLPLDDVIIVRLPQ